MADRTQFAAAVLKGIGAPVTPKTVAGFIGWSNAEGGDNWSRNNPLNTTETLGGQGAINSAGVQRYGSPQAGVRATVKTLRNGRYNGIIGAFKANNPLGMPASELNTWGTGSLTYQTVRQALGQHFNVPSGSSSLGAPTSGQGGGQRFRTTPGSTTRTTRQVFNQQAYQQAQARTVVGNLIASTPNPYKAVEAKTGLSSAPNPLISSGLLTPGAMPNPQDFMHAQTTLQRIAGSRVPLNQHPAAFQGHLAASGYTNPLPGAQWEQTDMGVDASMRDGAPIKAMTDSVVTNIHTFYQGQPIITFKILNGPKAGKFYYISEAIHPLVHVGSRVRAGQTVGHFYSGGTGLEIGWAGDAQGNTLTQTTAPQQVATRHSGSGTTAGRNFRNFLHGLGANV